MAFQQLIAGKVKLNGIGGIRRHLQERERVKTNPNIDLTRSHLNYCIEDLTPDNLVSRVNSRIKQLNLKKHPRSDAVGLEDIIISASSDFMLNLETEKCNQYFSDALHFFQNRYGKENVMYCQCHLDESNPHIHVGIVPVTADGRLSAKSLFTPKTLEKLQTDFHHSVSSLDGLERGEHHDKKYLPLQQFKAKQAKIKTATFTDDLHSAELSLQEINKISKSIHYATSGLIFTSKDKSHVKLSTNDFLQLKEMAEQGVKALASINILKDDIQNLQRDNWQTNSDLKLFLHQLNKLEKDTAKYSAVPPAWRKNIDSSIDNWQKTFTAYCHDFNRAIVRVFIATNGNFDKTEQILRPLFSHLNVKNPQKYIESVISAAKLQFRKNIHPQSSLPSWKPPKPSETDYSKPDGSGIVSLQLSKVSDIKWDMINWDLLSELDKDELRHKQIFRDL
jgi:hypothetical protein